MSTGRLQNLRPNDSGSDQLAANSIAILITGPIFYTAVGWLADRWLHTSPWLTVAGLLLGMALSIYLLWIRYGTTGQVNSPATTAPDRKPTSNARDDHSMTVNEEYK